MGQSDVCVWVSHMSVWVSEMSVWVSEMSVWVSQMSVWVSQMSVWVSQMSVYGIMYPLHRQSLCLFIGCLAPQQHASASQGQTD